MAASFTGREQRTTPHREDVGSCSQDYWEDVGSCSQDYREDAGSCSLWDIFLSHSPLQEAFVKDLYEALTRIKLTVCPVMGRSLVGNPFRPTVERAICGCRLGIVVLSEGFLTSPWSMQELEMLFENGRKVLALFYTLSIEDLKSQRNIDRWRTLWKNMVESEQQESRWAAALKQLPSIYGIVFEQQKGEPAYIEKVVDSVCYTFYPCYDQTSYQGIQALTEEVAGYFDKLVENVEHPEEACMVGLHGVGGLGKTTLCKSMVNFYGWKYFGRSFLIEFPSSRDMQCLLKDCLLAMTVLFDLSGEGLEISSFDQVVGLMKKHMCTFDVFLAIDNVCDHSMEEAGRLLNVGFTANSKVLVTSRSKFVLMMMFYDRNQKNKNYCRIDSLPAVNKEGAFQIFQQIVHQGDLTSLPFRDRIDLVLEGCRDKNDGRYYPLAVRLQGAAAASYLRGRNADADDRLLSGKRIAYADHWSLILRRLEICEMKDMKQWILENFDTLDEYMQRLLLDIAVWYSSPAFKPFLRCTVADVILWLQFHYKEFTEEELKATILSLEDFGVICPEEGQYGETMIKIHDWFVAFAQQKAAKGCRFLTSTNGAVWGMEWGELKRVILAKPEQDLRFHEFEWGELKRMILAKPEQDLRFHEFERLKLHRCEKLELLYLYGIDLKHFPESIVSLRVLILQWPRHFDSKSTLLNLNGFVNLEYLSLGNLPSLVKLEGQNGFLNLRMFFLRDSAHVEDLDILRCSTQLEALVIDAHFDHAWATLKGPEVWKKCWPDLFTALQKSTVSGCTTLRGLPDLSPALKLLNVTGCTALKRLPDLGGLTALETLWLHNKALKRLPDLGGLVALQTLWLHNNRSLVELGAFSPALKTVIITDCPAVRLLDLGSATGLEALIWLRSTDPS